MIEAGGHAEVWKLNGQDHAFTVIGHPPGNAMSSRDFADWKGVWIADPWTGTVAEAPEFVAKLLEKMEKWQSEGKRIRTETDVVDATDRAWMDAIRDGEKSRVAAPSAGNPNPWRHFTAKLDDDDPDASDASSDSDSDLADQPIYLEVDALPPGSREDTHLSDGGMDEPSTPVGRADAYDSADDAPMDFAPSAPPVAREIEQSGKKPAFAIPDSEAEANRTIAEEVFAEVRRAYEAGRKSDNKLPKGKEFSHTDAAAEALYALQDRNIYNKENGISVPHQDNLVIDGANCLQLSECAAKRVTERGGHAELIAFRSETSDGALVSHVFTLVGKPPAEEDWTMDFSGWDGRWIVDPWANLVVHAPEYNAALGKKLLKWQDEGKRIRIGTDETYIDAFGWHMQRAVFQTRKINLQRPTWDQPNPWSHFTSTMGDDGTPPYALSAKNESLHDEPSEPLRWDTESTEASDVDA